MLDTFPTVTTSEAARLDGAATLVRRTAFAYGAATRAHLEADKAWSRAMTAEYGCHEGATRGRSSARWDGRGTRTPHLQSLAMAKAEACAAQSHAFAEMLGAQSLHRGLCAQFGIDPDA